MRLFSISPRIHDDYQHSTRSILERLLAAFPGVELSSVDVFDEEGDRSMGHAGGGTIYLNAYWFSRPREFFTAAVLEARRTTPEGFPLWHGGIGGVDQEYERLLIHEFGHLVKASVPGADEFAAEKSRAARDNPALAVSGYALADDDGTGEEWWAEVFDALILGGSDSPQVDEMRAFLRGDR